MSLDQMMLVGAVLTGALLLVLSLLLSAGNKKAAAIWFVAFLVAFSVAARFGINGLTLLIALVVLTGAFWLASRVLGSSKKK